MAMNASAARFLLGKSGNNIKAARKQLERAMTEAKGDIVLAHKLGISITEISNLTGLTRQTIYTALDEAAQRKKY